MRLPLFLLLVMVGFLWTLALRPEAKGPACYQAGLSVGRSQAMVFQAQADGYQAGKDLIARANKPAPNGCK